MGRGRRLAALLVRHRERIVRFFMGRQQLTPAEAEDAFLKLIERVFTRASNIREPKALRGWLYGLARNLCFEQLRSRRNLSEVPLPDEDEAKSEHYGQEEALSADILHMRLKKAIAELPQHLRDAYILVIVEESSSIEACEALGCGRTTLWERVREASALIHSAVQFGMIEGSVRDTLGNRIAGVLVTLRGKVIPLSRKALTNKRESFRFHLLPPGDYLLMAESTNYAQWRKDVVVTPGRVTVEIQLSGSQQRAETGGGHRC